MFRATPCSVLLMTVLSTLSTTVSSAEIVSTSFDGYIDSLDLTAAGTKDWAVFGVKESSGSAGAREMKNETTSMLHRSDPSLGGHAAR